MSFINFEKVSLNIPIYEKAFLKGKQEFKQSDVGGIITRSKKGGGVSALQNISFQLRDGDRLGIIGHNGAGKTTLLKMILGIYEPTSGHIKIEGKIGSLFEASAGMNVELTGLENIQLRGIMLGLKKKQIEIGIKQIAEFTALGNFLSMPVSSYSQGMQLRLSFALNVWITPNILLLDEAFGVGDMSFVERAQEAINRIYSQTEIIVFASHQLKFIEENCNLVLWLEHGQVKTLGDTKTVIHAYQNYFSKQKEEII